jgi:hypothetical protein
VIPLLSALQRLLLEEWDPIGIRDAPEAVDEYDSYAFEIFTMLHAATPSTAENIAAYLTLIEKEHMGLDSRPAHNRRVAAMIHELSCST